MPMPMLMPIMFDISQYSRENLCKHVEESAQQQWLEMEVLSVTFTAYTAPNGLMVVGV